MEIGATPGSSTNQAQDVQALRNVLLTQEAMTAASLKDEQKMELEQADRSKINSMSHEITQALSDAMSIMKKTGDEARNSGR